MKPVAGGFVMTADRLAHGILFCSKVQYALDDKRPDISHEEIEALFKARREASRLK